MRHQLLWIIPRGSFEVGSQKRRGLSYQLGVSREIAFSNELRIEMTLSLNEIGIRIARGLLSEPLLAHFSMLKLLAN